MAPAFEDPAVIFFQARTATKMGGLVEAVWQRDGGLVMGVFGGSVQHWSQGKINAYPEALLCRDSGKHTIDDEIITNTNSILFLRVGWHGNCCFQF